MANTIDSDIARKIRIKLEEQFHPLILKDATAAFTFLSNLLTGEINVENISISIDNNNYKILYSSNTNRIVAYNASKIPSDFNVEKDGWITLYVLGNGNDIMSTAKARPLLREKLIEGYKKSHPHKEVTINTDNNQVLTFGGKRKTNQRKTNQRKTNQRKTKQRKTHRRHRKQK